MKLHTTIILILGILIVAIYCSDYLNIRPNIKSLNYRDDFKNMQMRVLSNKDSKKVIEGFHSESSDNKTEKKALINNGSFQNGKDITNFHGDKVGNSIVAYPNPGKSSYVIRQTAKVNSQNHYPTKYPIMVDVKPNLFYKLSVYVNYSSDYDGNTDLFYILTYRDSNEPNIISGAGKVSHQEKIYNNKWEKKIFIFQVPPDCNGKIDVYLGYHPQNTKGYRYLTDIQLDLFHPLLGSYPVIEQLKLLMISFNKDSYNGNNSDKVWKDITGIGNDFNWSNTPKWNKFDGFDISNNKLVGTDLKEIITDLEDFSIVLFMQGVYNNSGTLLEVDSKNSKVSLEISSSYDTSFIKIQIKNRIIIWKTGIPVTKSLFVLNKKENTIELWKDGILLKNESDNNLDSSISDSDILVINPSKKTKGRLFSLALYDKTLTKTEIIQLKQYYHSLINSSLNIKDISFNEYQCPDTSKYLFKDLKPIGSSQITSQEKITELKKDFSVTTKNNECPFKNKCADTPCNTIECNNVDWKNSSLPSKCNNVVKRYCNEHKDATCSKYTGKDFVKGSCTASKKIIDSLKDGKNNRNINNETNNETNNQTNNETNNQTNNNRNNKLNNKTHDLKEVIYQYKGGKNCPTCPKINTCKPVPDMSNYIRKDKIPCWGCNL